MKRNPTTQCTRRTAGTGSVEFALGASVFLLLTFAIIELAMVVYSYNSISQAARECVRYAIVHSKNGPYGVADSQIQNITVSFAALPAPNQLMPADVAISWPADPNLPSEQDAQCTISLNYSLRIPFMATRTLPLSATARMLVSQ